MPDTSIEAGKIRYEQYSDARHYINAPSRAHAVLRVLIGDLESLEVSLSDDPALAAYQVRDAAPRIRGNYNELVKWADAVIQAYPDDIPDKGARLCHS